MAITLSLGVVNSTASKGLRLSVVHIHVSDALPTVVIIPVPTCLLWTAHTEESVQVSGDGTLQWGDYIGNNMFMSLGEPPVLRCSRAGQHASEGSSCLWRTTIIL